MIWCLRISPLVAAAVLALRARWLVGLFTGSGTRGATSWSTALSAPASVQLSHAVNLLRGAGTLVSQFFAWMFVLIGLCALWGVAAHIVAEIKLNRELRRPIRRPRRFRG
jgi:hypothetical protein